MSAFPILFFLLMLLTIPGGILLRRGREQAPNLSEPYCAKCGYDLRTFGDAPKVCSECGADLTTANTIRWGKYPSRPRLIWAGVVLTAIPMMLLVGLHLYSFRTTRGFVGSGSGSKSNQQLVASVTANFNSPSDWMEIEDRLQRGAFTQAEVTQAIDLMAAGLEQAAPAKNQSGFFWVGSFLRATERQIQPEQWLRIAKARYGEPRLRLSSRVRAGRPIPFELVWDAPHLELCERVWALRGAQTQNVKTLRILGSYNGPEVVRWGMSPPADPDMLSATSWQSIRGQIQADLPLGEHEFAFTVDAGMLVDSTNPSMNDGPPGQLKHWPKGRARWVIPLKKSVTVIPADQSPIELVPESEALPLFKISSAKVTKSIMGAETRIEIVAQGPGSPFSFDVEFIADNARASAGHYVLRSLTSGESEKRSFHVVLPALARSVERAELVLRTNPKHAESTPGLDAIWNGEHRLRSIELQRFDIAVE